MDFKRLLIVLCCLALTVTLTACQSQPAAQLGKPILADFAAQDLSGNIVDQSILSGCKLTMVNVWATFCSPCIGEMPDLALLNQAYPGEFQVIGIVLDAADKNAQVLPDKKAEALDIIDRTGANYRHLLPSASLNKALLSGVQAIPETIFVDSAGRQVGPSYTGAKSHAQWKSIIEGLLKTVS